MSRRRRSKQRSGRDDSLPSLTPRLPRSEPLADLLSLPRAAPGRGFFSPDPLDLREFEDRRLWYPAHHVATGYRPPGTFFGVPARVVAGQARKAPVGRSSPLPDLYPAVRVGFEEPRSTLICVRRKQRREVLHAFGVAGRRGLRPPRRSQFSAITCRR